MKRTFAMLIAAIFTSTFLVACNTMEGMGQDVQAGGKKLEDAADRKK